MGKLRYSVIASVDGFVCDDEGSFDWAMPDDQVHAFINDLERSVGTYLYGRRMYETMRFWEAPPDLDQEPAVFRDYAAVWAAATKVVYSTTLSDVDTARTRLVRTFDVAEVARLKQATASDLSIGGPEIASHALAAGLVDEIQIFLAPVVVGSGTHYLASRLPGMPRLDLDLLSVRRFDNGMTYQHYAIR
ncbi:MAG: dihydrofolate reductase family protein [Actinomycetes bacterium]